MRAAAQARGETVAQLAQRVDASTREKRRLLLVVFVPCLALALTALYATRRVFVSERAVLTVQLTIGLPFVVAGAAFAEPLTIGALARFGGDVRRVPALIEVRVRWVTLAVLVCYVYAALRRAHGDGPLAALARAAAVAVGIIMTLELYDALVEWVIRRAL